MREVRTAKTDARVQSAEFGALLFARGAATAGLTAFALRDVVVILRPTRAGRLF